MTRNTGKWATGPGWPSVADYGPAGFPTTDGDIGRKWAVFAGGGIVGKYDTEAEAETAAEDVRGDFPDLEVEIDVVTDWG